MPLVGNSLSREFNRRVNLRAFFIFIIVIAVIGTSVYFVHGVQIRRHAGHFLDRAHQAREEGDTQLAIDQLDRYLQLVPDDADAMAELGLLLADNAPGRRAYELLERTLLFQPENEDVRRRLVDLAVIMGRFSDAREHLEDRLLITHPDDSKLLELLARCEAGQGDFKAAAATLKKAIEVAPDQVDFYRYLADVLSRQLEKPEEAKRWMENLVEANPNSARAHMLRGDYLRIEEEPEKAADEAAKALKLAPEDLDCLWLAAMCAVDTDDLEVARKHALRGLELAPKEARMFAALADAEIKAGDRPKAIEWLREGLDKDPEADLLLRKLVLLMIDGGKAAEAQATLDKLRGTRLPEALLEYLQARIDLLNGEWKTASQRLEYAKGGLDRWLEIRRDAEYWLGKCYARLGATESQVAAYRRAMAIDRMWIPARLELVNALLAAGEVEEALVEQQRLMQLPDAPADSASRLAWIRLLANRKKDPEKRDWTGVEQLIQTAEKADPTSPQTILLKAETLAEQDRLDEAEKLIRSALSAAPTQITYWIALAGLCQKQQHWVRAEEVLNDATTKLGDVVPLRLARARLLLARDPDRARAGVDKLAEPPATYSSAETAQLWRGLIPVYLRIGDTDEARRLAGEAAKKQPEDLPLRLLLFELAFKTKDAAGMESILEEIERIEGQGPYWHYGQAVRSALAAETADKQANLAKALKHLDEAAKLRPTWGRIPLLAGQIHDMRGEEEQALESFSQAIELGELNPVAVRRTAQALYSAERYDEASQLIQRLERQRGGSLGGDLGRLASNISLRTEQFDRGLDTAREAVEDSKDYRDYMWLGQVAGAMGQRAKKAGNEKEAEELFAEAEQAFRDATKVGGDVSQTWLALVYFLSRTGKVEQATTALSDARNQIPAEDLPLALAQAYEILGRRAEANAKYDEALTAAPGNPRVIRAVTEYYLRTSRVREAREQLEKITSGKVPSTPTLTAWARRRLALLLIADPDPTRCRQAMSLIDANLNSPEASLADRRAKAMVYLADPLPGKNAEAIETMKAIVADSRLAGPEDRFLLARLYLAENDWSKARGLLQSLAAETRKPRYLAGYIEALLDRKEFGNAEVWLRTLEEASPHDFATVGFRARIALAQGKTDQAIEVLDAYVADDEATLPSQDDRLAVVANWIERYANTLDDDKHANQVARLRKEAETRAREYVKRHPGAEPTLVSFLMRNDQPEKAATLADKIAEDADPGLIGKIGLLLLEGKAAEDPKHLARVEDFLRRAIDKHASPIHLLLLLADVTTRLGRYEETETLYRDVLNRQADNVAALNNLAILLALQDKNLDEALQMVNRTLELAPGLSTLLDSRATVYLASGQPDKALADLDVAIAESPKATRYFHRAQVYFQTGKKELAREAFRTAKQRGLDPATLHSLELPIYRQMNAALR